ncbi:enoyl-CoA hydratase/isomerase family protein [Pontibaca methylaminivorans]|uniref:Enoyl-CoA hydratase n=1 Tax=Pontibaca methylaminivorans TaxID=515897 RepID=A0A1R3WXD2_9RHOB|nr:enoyl-CoA hydratase/isomerase family protein [Pontibaca methylaminivorans]SIT82810.1 enoyl-CoA hydratase [Pontibaca methylaminivorans]
MTDLVILTRSGPVAEIVLNRADKLNAITAPMVGAIESAMDAAERDPAVRVILLRGEGRAFSAGFDLGELDPEADPRAMKAMLEADFHMIMRFWNSPKPTISAVQGYVLGGGFELAMACDVTLASEDALFGEPEPKFGSGIVALLLPWLGGSKLAREMLLFGNDRVEARRAEALGLVNGVVAPERLREAALDMARRAALLDGNAVRLTKQAINRSYSAMGFEAALRQALDLDVEIETTETDESRVFKEILNRDGVKAAIAWREARFLTSTAEDHPG